MTCHAIYWWKKGTNQKERFYGGSAQVTDVNVTMDLSCMAEWETALYVIGLIEFKCDFFLLTSFIYLLLYIIYCKITIIFTALEVCMLLIRGLVH